MKTKGITIETVEVDVLPLNFLIDLFKHEFKGYDIYDEFKIEDNKLFVYTDLAWHGSSLLEEKLISDDEKQIEKFNCLKKLIKLYSENASKN